HLQGFRKIENMDAETVSEALKKWLDDLGLDKASIVGQGYDGASNMSGVRNGVQARIKEVSPCADYLHCPNHKLNLAVTDAAQTPAMARAMGHIKKAIDYFSDSPKRAAV